MIRYFDHVAKSWRALSIASLAFLVVPLFYAIYGGLKGVFEIESVLLLTLFALCFGALLYLVYSAFEISRQDRVKDFFSNMNLRSVGNGSLKLVDEYTNGWGRRVIITGVHQKKKIQIYHSYDKGISLNVLVQLENDFFEQASSVKVDKSVTSASLTKILDDAIVTSNDPKFGEIYWELKRRRRK